jgi:hypothetical protein
MKNVCRDICYCVQYYREDWHCPHNEISDCGKFDEKLRSHGKHDHRGWVRDRIERYFINHE